jgi:hypothetical protein
MRPDRANELQGDVAISGSTPPQHLHALNFTVVE